MSRLIFESAVMMSSAMPSAKNSCSGSALITVKGRMAIEGRSGMSKSRPIEASKLLSRRPSPDTP